MHIEFLNGPEHPAEIEELFREYTDMLVAGDPVFASYLALQSFDEELRHLEGKYAPPEGCLYLLRVDGQNAGCGGMKRLDESRCELKRMYIRPSFRRMGLGRELALRIIEDAREAGYRRMLLDTLPFLQAAKALYRSLGFYEIERYNDSPMGGASYLCLDLRDGKEAQKSAEY
ncbi:MAG: GNAT family N-acetyltransferase [Oscillospiraceae bacterium]|nr:GNAT family N-acetyltransferase [Oscillospiraceae bacterium]